MAFGQQKLSKETGGPDFYQEYTTTNMYVERSFSGALHTITVKNDSTTDPLQLSFDGSTLESDVKVGETLELNVAGKTSVYVKATTGGDTVRIWGWADVKGAGTTNLAAGLVPEAHDYIALSYTGSNLTGVVYKTGGAGGTTVATLTLAYTGAVLDTVTRT